MPWSHHGLHGSCRPQPSLWAQWVLPQAPSTNLPHMASTPHAPLPALLQPSFVPLASASQPEGQCQLWAASQPEGQSQLWAGTPACSLLNSAFGARVHRCWVHGCIVPMRGEITGGLCSGRVRARVRASASPASPCTSMPRCLY